MQQVPMRFWNEIAQTQEMKSPLWAAMFSLSPEQLSGATDDLTKALKLLVQDERVMLAYLLAAPLLVENEAISRYLIETDSLHLRSSMPELQTVGEAVILASREYRLKPSQQRQLDLLLKLALETPESVPHSEKPKA